MEWTAEQILELTKGSAPHWLEFFYWVSQILILGVIVAAARYAKNQLDQMRSDSEQTLKNSQASILLGLDDRWESTPMMESRAMFVEVNREIIKNIADNFPEINDEARVERMKENWCTKLGTIFRDDDDIDKYHKLMRMCGFFESVGLMVSRDYISEKDVLGLFRGSMVSIDRCYSKHIVERSHESGMPKGLYQHALSLCANAKAVRN